MKYMSRCIGVVPLLLLTMIPVKAQSYGSELNLGVDAYRNFHYEAATQHFRKATELDPNQPVAHLYLATAYASQYIPGVDTPDNLLVAEQAIEQYHRVLDLSPTGSSGFGSVQGIASLYLNMKRFDDSKKYYGTASQMEPNDPEPYYSVGVIDWTISYQVRTETRARLRIRSDEYEYLNHRDPDQKKACDNLRSENSAAIDKGIRSLRKAIELRPDYDDAMAYMNLMYREKADVECEDLVAREQDLETAEEGVDKTLATKKEKAGKSAAPTVPNPQ